MKASGELLSLYKEYETLLRDGQSEPRRVEQDIAVSDPARSSRLTIVRQFRNYLTHEDDPGFLEPTEKMLAFLRDEVRDLKLRGDVCRRHLRTRAVFCYGTDKCGDVLAKMAASRRDVIVRDDDGYSLLSVYDVAKAAQADAGAPAGSVKAMRQKPAFASPLDRVDRLDRDRVTVVTSDYGQRPRQGAGAGPGSPPRRYPQRDTVPRLRGTGHVPYCRMQGGTGRAAEGRRLPRPDMIWIWRGWKHAA